MAASQWGPAWLFSPADRPDRVLKAAELADVVIIDLEDAVHPERRQSARESLPGIVSLLNPDTTIVRINARGTLDGERDLIALADTPIITYMLAKSEDRAAIEQLAPKQVVALCETAAGILNLGEIASAHNCVGVMWGSEDLAADLGSPSSRDMSGSLGPALQQSRLAALIAARANDCAAVDTVHTEIDEMAGLVEESAAAAGLGFDAKACVHPRQVEMVRRAFRPTEAAMDHAERLLARAASETGLFVFEGRMIDEPVIRRAKATVARALG